MTTTIRAAELEAGDFITGDRAYPAGTLHLDVLEVIETAPSRLIVAVCSSRPYGIERHISYGPDEAVMVRRSSR